MLTLLAESKTMSSSQYLVEESQFAQHTPVLESCADSIMAYIESLSPKDIAERMGVSLQLAVKAHSFAYDFPDKHTGYDALHAFTGEAFKGLDVTTLTGDAIQRANQDLKFISSVYGILNSSDIIKPYRCEFNKMITPDQKTPIQYFKQKVTIELAKYIKANKVTDIIDLLPADADKCVDWKIIRAFTKVQKVVFQEIGPDGKLKTPIAKRLKELRGKMARKILMDGIDTFSELINSESEDFLYSPEHSKSLLPVFLSVQE